MWIGEDCVGRSEVQTPLAYAAVVRAAHNDVETWSSSRVIGYSTFLLHGITPVSTVVHMWQGSKADYRLRPALLLNE